MNDQTWVDVQTEKNVEEYFCNSGAMEEAVDRCQSDIARLLVLHWNEEHKLIRLIKQQLRMDIDEEAAQDARDKWEEEGEPA